MVAALFFGDEFRRTGDPGGAGPVLFRAVLLPKVQVGGDVAGEEDVFLGHIPDDGAQIVHAVPPDVDAVHQDLPEEGIIEPGDQLQNAGFAPPRPADDGGDLAGVGGKADVLEDRLVRAGVGEGHMAELQRGAQGALLKGVVPVPDAGLCLQDLRDAGGTGVGGRKHHNDQGQHDHRGQHHADILAVGHQRAHLHGPGVHIVGPKPQDGRCGYAEDHIDGGEEQVGDPPSRHGGQGVVPIGLPEAAALRLLLVEGPDDPHSLQGLQEESVDPVQLPAELDGIAGGQDHDGRQGGDQDWDGDGQYGADLSPSGGGEHQPGHRHHGSQDADAQQHGEKILHIGDVRGAPGDQAGRPEAVHLSGGEGLHLVEHTLTEQGSKLGGDAGGQPDRTQIDKTGEHSDDCHDDGEDSDRGAGLHRHPAVDHPGQKSGQHHLPDSGQQHQDRQPGHLPSAQRYLGEDRFHRVFVCLLDVE